MTISGEIQVAVFTLLGVLLGTVLAAVIQWLIEQQRGANERRLNTLDERRRVELLALHAAYNMREALKRHLNHHKAAYTEEEDLAQARAFEELVAMSEDLDRHALSVAVLGSKEVSARISDMSAYLFDYLMGLEPHFWGVESRAVIEGIDGKFDGVVREIRADLYVDELDRKTKGEDETIWESVTWAEVLPELDRESKSMGKFESAARFGRRPTRNEPRLR